MIGRELDGRYRILEKLGEGGMGEVYLVEHLHLGRKEALKILRPGLGDTPELVARFRREARAANRVQHPNIIGIYDFGQLPDGRFFLAMEYAGGEAVSDLLARAGRLSVSRALQLLAQLAAAIDHAHSLGVIHRDLKPSNLVVTQRKGQKEVLKVVDFGIAKIIAPEYTDSVGATRQGQVYGTPAYMAPELVAGHGADPRIDIYALGCIGFELLVGEPPFVGSMVSIMNAQIRRAPPRPSDRRPGDVADELDELILRCLEKDPDRRFQTGREARKAIMALSAFDEGRTPSGRRSYRVIPLSALPPVPPTGGFEDIGTDAETADHEGTQKLVVDALAASELGHSPTLSPAEAASPFQARHEYHHALRTLVEALVDAGCGDFQLRIGLVGLNELAAEIEKLVNDRDELERHDLDAEQRFREREASLRFAIGELAFERDRGTARGHPPPVALHEQITQLENRLSGLANDYEEECNSITERGIALAAALATKEEELAELHQALGRLVAELADPLTSTADIPGLRARVAAARQRLLLSQAIAPDPA